MEKGIKLIISLDCGLLRNANFGNFLLKNTMITV